MSVLRAQIEALSQAKLGKIPRDIFGGLMQRANLGKKMPRVENVTIAIGTKGATDYDPQKADYYMSVTRGSDGTGIARMGGRMVTQAFQKAVRHELASTNRIGKNHPFIDPAKINAPEYIVFDNDKMMDGTGLDNEAIGALMNAFSNQVKQSIKASPEVQFPQHNIA